MNAINYGTEYDTLSAEVDTLIVARDSGEDVQHLIDSKMDRIEQIVSANAEFQKTQSDNRWGAGNAEYAMWH